MHYLIGFTLFAVLTNACQADDAQSRKCGMMQTVALSITTDRDSGVGFLSRIEKNDRLTAGTNGMRGWVNELTSAIYGELKNRPASEIGHATYVSCLRGK